jgi:hypothetical protein
MLSIARPGKDHVAAYLDFERPHRFSRGHAEGFAGTDVEAGSVAGQVISQPAYAAITAPLQGEPVDQASKHRRTGIFEFRV